MFSRGHRGSEIDKRFGVGASAKIVEDKVTAKRAAIDEKGAVGIGFPLSKAKEAGEVGVGEAEEGLLKAFRSRPSEL